MGGRPATPLYSVTQCLHLTGTPAAIGALGWTPAPLGEMKPLCAPLSTLPGRSRSPLPAPTPARVCSALTLMHGFPGWGDSNSHSQLPGRPRSRAQRGWRPGPAAGGRL